MIYFIHELRGGGERKKMNYKNDNSHLEVAKVLLANGANVHTLENEALREASKNDNFLELAKLLLEAWG